MIKHLRRWINSAQGLRRAINVYGPYLGAGIRVDDISDDFRFVKVSMAMKWYNRNYVGTHFGGSLYAMIDPFYMFMLMHNLGRDYIVWDQSASIDFISPGTGRVWAEFVIDQAQLDLVLQHTADGNAYRPEWPVIIRNEQGDVVAKAKKTLYIRKKIAKTTAA